MTFHFISGLPRSGSSLLAALLRQNPAFHASFMSPLGSAVLALRKPMSPPSETAVLWSPMQRSRVIESMFEAYYEQDLDKVIFDTNRRWTLDASLLTAVFPSCKIICMVRDVPSIVNSFEHLFAQNPGIVSSILGESDPNVYRRSEILMDVTGVVGFAYQAYKQAMFGAAKDRLLTVEYSYLVTKPQETLDWLHDHILIPRFAYNLAEIEPLPGAAEFDRGVGCPGLHDVKPKVVLPNKKSLLPPDLVDRLPPPFWRVNEVATTRS